MSIMLETVEKSKKAFKVIKTYCQFNPLIKISEDDMLRLFEKELPHEDIFQFFMIKVLKLYV
jgi:fructokinase